MRQHYGFHGNIKKAENRPQVLSNTRGTGKTGKDPGSGSLVSYGRKSAATDDFVPNTSLGGHRKPLSETCLYNELPEKVND